MSVDMFEWRFRQELERVERFTPNDARDGRVWGKEFPAWRALFTSLCFYGHSTGYRLFSFEEFFRYCEGAYCKQHSKKERFEVYFAGDLRAGMRQRVGAWYESGMAETYLYVCLVEAIEDKLKEGMVLYDARADWKLKADLIVLANGCQMRVSAFTGEETARPEVEAQRDMVERERKQNTMESAHWGNRELDRMPTLTIARTPEYTQEINGVRVFSLAAIDGLLTEVYDAAGTEGRFYFSRRNTVS